MRIAMIAPLIEAVPPERYGGTERVVSVLTEKNWCGAGTIITTVRAAAARRRSARLVACSDGPLRASPPDTDTVAHVLVEMNEVYSRAGSFDIIHNHNDYLAFSFARACATPTVTHRPRAAGPA